MGPGDFIDRCFPGQYLHGRGSRAIYRIDGKELGAMAAPATAISNHLLGVAIYESKSGVSLFFDRKRLSSSAFSQPSTSLNLK